MEYFIIAVFCKIDELLKEVTKTQSVRAKGFEPALSDSEVITMEIVAEYQGIDTDIGIWKYFRKHWQEWFPALKSRTTFVRQAANLWQYKAMRQETALRSNMHILVLYSLRTYSLPAIKSGN
ncbi:hypothetical protein V2H45_21915 [Tumidithrix elongata RA019]|uniref:Transposase n=1 Tax=Tumidithrix elongata BACA0141 TaxID=2716417 RepID=A0AAW9Q4G2_9CYAN|nr:hypothetical protein [Tumidithrix elongata RA019]